MKHLKTPKIILAYRTDSRLSTDSKRLIYIGEDIEDVIGQLQEYRGMTEKQAEQVRRNRQSQCSGEGYEWILEYHHLNCFTD